MAISISMRKAAIYARRGSSRQYAVPDYWVDGRESDVSPMEKAHQMHKAADPDFQKTIELQEKRFIEGS